MAEKPGTDDLIGWLRLQTDPSEDAYAVYEEAMEAAIADIEGRVDLPAGTDATHYPQEIRTAILLDAARLAKRSTSPEGVAGMADIGAVVHIVGRDPDIERLIMRFRKLTGFA